MLASAELGEDDADKRPTVQIGDPFTGKKLIEVSVELVERGLVESLQDCGAAGLASALAEMARDGAGVDVHLDRVPLREELEPWEIMISESQERMVAVVRPGFLEAVEEVCGRWELHCTPIGEVTDTGDLRAFHDGELQGEIRAEHLTEEAPRYRVEPTPRAAAPEPMLPAGPPREQALLELLASPNIRSRSWIYERYDQLVGSRTVRRPGLGAAVLRLRPSLRGLAVSLDGPGRVAALAPRTGGALAVLEAARNVACSGGEPLGLTDCLNFGNPEKGEIAWELAEAIEGMARAAEALRIPVVSGNVSLYNETDGRAITPAPVVGCVGLVPDVRTVPGRWREGDAIVLAGAPELSFAGSEYQALWGQTGGQRGEPRPRRRDHADRVPLARGAAPLRSRTTRRPAASRSRSPRRRSGAASAPTSSSTATSSPGSARAAGRRSSPARHDDLPRLGGVALTQIGEVGGDRVLGVKLADLGKAYY